jgi:hypothetical protein
VTRAAPRVLPLTRPGAALGIPHGIPTHATTRRSISHHSSLASARRVGRRLSARARTHSPPAIRHPNPRSASEGAAGAPRLSSSEQKRPAPCSRIESRGSAARRNDSALEQGRPIEYPDSCPRTCGSKRSPAQRRFASGVREIDTDDRGNVQPRRPPSIVARLAPNPVMSDIALASSSPGRIHSFVAQRFDHVETRSAQRWVDAEDQADEHARAEPQRHGPWLDVQ